MLAYHGLFEVFMVIIIFFFFFKVKRPYMLTYMLSVINTSGNIKRLYEYS